MSPVTKRGKRTAYDNIAAGSSFDTRERTYTDTVSVFERYGGGQYTSTSTEVGGTDIGQTNVAAGTSTSDDNIGPENIIVAGTAFAEENVG